MSERLKRINTAINIALAVGITILSIAVIVKTVKFNKIMNEPTCELGKVPSYASYYEGVRVDGEALSDDISDIRDDYPVRFEITFSDGTTHTYESPADIVNDPDSVGYISPNALFQCNSCIYEYGKINLVFIQTR